MSGKNYDREAKPDAPGRFPANIILDEEVTNEDWKRYFYCAKASKKERNAGLEVEKEKNPRPVGEAFGGGNAITSQSQSKGNNHPTVKPLALMEYLVKLTATPTGGRVLDPFMGSGTTGIACKKQGRDFIGIEKDEEYFEIAKKRIDHPT